MLKKYRSKVSYGLLGFIFFVFLGIIVLLWIEGEIHSNSMGTAIFLLILFVVIVHMFLQTHYTIYENELKIKSGFFSFRPIEIAEIKEISKTKSLLSSPAPSFDRIKIKYGKFESIIISPKDKYNFAQDLVNLNPQIKNNISET